MFVLTFLQFSNNDYNILLWNFVRLFCSEGIVLYFSSKSAGKSVSLFIKRKEFAFCICEIEILSSADSEEKE